MNSKSLATSLLLTLCFIGISKAEGPERPNILILLGDDIDRDTLGPWGGDAHTPNLDQLASEGIRLDRAYSNVAMCAPFRQELYSGRSSWRTRAMPNHSRSKAGTKSLPHYLRPLGYRVGLLGKSHVGPKDAYPFDRVGDLPMKEDPNPQALKLASGYIREARDAGDPFCLVVASHDGHGPYTHGDVDQYDPKSFALSTDAIDTPIYRKQLAQHFAEVTNLDALLGGLRSILADEKLAENTLVLFCSEQGNAFPFAKWTCFDDALATGIVAALPGKIPASQNVSQIAWLSDIVPTLIEAAGGEVNNEDFDGRSQWANFTGGDETVHDYAFGAFTNCNILENRERVFPIRSIRSDRYTLIWSPLHDQGITSNLTLSQALSLLQTGETKGPDNTATSWVRKAQKVNRPRQQQLIHRLHHRPEWGLYDRKADPDELNNLVDDPRHAAALQELKSELSGWLSKWDDADPVATEKGFVRKH